MKLSVGYITAPTKAEAKQIVETLLAEGLIACATILPDAESYFVWKKELIKKKEAAIVIKTRTKNEEKIIQVVREIHSYECPCVVFWSLDYGNSDFLKWVDKNS
ncbi:divalent-cation tolerance protein CutA [Candidatus Peregrinibacteria bacterium CG_4_10_14_0_2_um_filter_43_11]|nr:MAG: divalent-cation tolerance protein CutA [Candidatus Peregrinibacteria bacterium CG_4_10_14_0_2_um_filter_43_11]